MKMSWKNPGNYLKIHKILQLSIFLEEINDHKSHGSILPHITVLENLNFDLEKSWKMHVKGVGTLIDAASRL